MPSSCMTSAIYYTSTSAPLITQPGSWTRTKSSSPLYHFKKTYKSCKSSLKESLFRSFLESLLDIDKLLRESKTKLLSDGWHFGSWRSWGEEICLRIFLVHFSFVLFFMICRASNFLFGDKLIALIFFCNKL